MKKQFTNSLAVQKRSAELIPGMTHLLSKRPDRFSYGIWPGYYSRAKGAEIWDLDDNRYIDMSIGGIGANILGYADSDVDNAVRSAIEKGVSSSLNCKEEVDLAELLCELHPWAEMARFARSGGEAVAIAVRIARAHTRRDLIAFCGYHGWHDWYLAANLGSTQALEGHLMPGLSPCGVPESLENTAFPFHYNKIEELENICKQYGDKLAAIVMEPIRNDDPVPGFLEAVKNLAEKTGAVLIFDEISAGFRMNSGGAHLLLGVDPDMAVFAKAIGNGYAMSAIIGKRHVMDSAQRSFISSTNWTERIGPAAALATIEKHRSVNAGDHLVRIGKQVQEGWRILAEKHDLKINIGGIPPLSHFAFEGEKSLFMKAMFIQMMLEKGFLASTLFYAMLSHSHDHVKQYLDAVDSSFKDIFNLLQNNELEENLRGKPSSQGFGRLI